MSSNSLQNSPMLTNEEKNWGMACHLSSLLGYVLAPSFNIFGPLIVWLIKRNESSFVDAQGKDALNFHISLTLYAILSVVPFLTIILIPIAFLLWGLIWLMGIICSVLGAIKASNGESYQYPLSIRFFS
jgi:uncharacterized Tic20 family protein